MNKYQQQRKNKQSSNKSSATVTNKFEIQVLQKLSQLMKPLVEENPIPRDAQDDHYIQSFDVSDSQGIIDFFDTFGFVVVRDVLSAQQCQDTLSEIYDILEEGSTFRRNDQSTWNAWPTNAMEHYGSMSRPPIFRKQFIENRINPNVYQTFKTLLKEDNLLVNHDRGCFYRPVVGVTGIPESVSMKWSTQPNIHLDMNPWNWIQSDGAEQDKALSKLRYGDRLNEFIFENNQVTHHDGVQLQAVMNLMDNYEEDGGYVVVPFFHKIFEEYFTEIRPKGDLSVPSHSFPKNDPIQKYAIRVPMRPGSMVVWSQLMPHGSFPTTGNRARSAQFLKMFPASHLSSHPARKKARASTLNHLLKQLPEPIQLTDQGKKLLGL
jgi:ectoine hydroxylase-related dioxygenase (phytanoyl-CoA dioxygenase family)